LATRSWNFVLFILSVLTGWSSCGSIAVTQMTQNAREAFDLRRAQEKTRFIANSKLNWSN
jgi:hypothetical protein